MRVDPVAGRTVFIAEVRATRPTDFFDPRTSRDYPSTGKSSETCPFCPGHEHETPPSLLEISNQRGDWNLRVVPNRFPTVNCDTNLQSLTQPGPPFSPPQSPLGAHEVIIESRQHIRDIDELSVDELAVVLQVYRDRLCHWAGDGRMRHATVFKNVGSAAGASLEHIHSQLVALPFVPAAMADEFRGAQQYFDRMQKCVFCDLVRIEQDRGARLVSEDGSFIAFCAYAGRQPYETWILPRGHDSHYQRLADDDLLPLAGMVRQVVRRIQSRLPLLSYNLMLHSAPLREPSNSHYHWHLEIIPRTSQLAGFEWSTGAHINSLAPERAASFLRHANL